MNLYQACRTGNLEKVIFLINAGACVNAQDYTKRTPLHVIGVNVNSTHHEQNDELRQADQALKCVQIVDRLIEKGSPVNARDRVGWTSLHWVAYFGITSC